MPSLKYQLMGIRRLVPCPVRVRNYRIITPTMRHQYLNVVASLLHLSCISAAILLQLVFVFAHSNEASRAVGDLSYEQGEMVHTMFKIQVSSAQATAVVLIDGHLQLFGRRD